MSYYFLISVARCIKLSLAHHVADFIPFIVDSMPEDEPSKHDGRIRTFSHFPGNWAMHVFIPCKLPVCMLLIMIILHFIFLLLYGKLVHDVNEHSDWFPKQSGPNFAIRTTKMDRLQIILAEFKKFPIQQPPNQLDCLVLVQLESDHIQFPWICTGACSNQGCH